MDGIVNGIVNCQGHAPDDIGPRAMISHGVQTDGC